MKNKLLLFLAIIGFAGLFTSCEEDLEIITLDNVTPPELITVPNLELQRSNATDTLTFVGSPADLGFQASVTYILETAMNGTDFASAVTIYSGSQVTAIKITVEDLNEKLLGNFPEDVTSSLDFRIRAQLKVEAGTGAPGTGSDPFEYLSSVETVDVTIYGLPRLDLVNSGIEQKIQSKDDNGIYMGLVKLSTASSFTLNNPVTGTSYGFSDGSLVADGAAFTVDGDGWHKVTANINDLTYTVEPWFIGLVGSATPNGWDVPDQKLEYNPASGTWSITLDLVDGDIKFRKNDDWGWNLGGTADALEQDGANIPVTAGNYTIVLTIPIDGSATGTFVITQN